MDPLNFLRTLRAQCLNAHSREGDTLATFFTTLLLDVDELQCLDDEEACRDFVRSCLDDLRLEIEQVIAQI